jgi:hypothetical protein
MNQAKDAATHASQAGGWLTEAFAALGAGIATFFAAHRLRGRNVLQFDDQHPLIQVIREEGVKTRIELAANREVMHQVVTGIEVLKDRRP